MLYVCVWGLVDVVFSVCIVKVWRCRCLCMGSMSVLSCSCYMFVSCVHPVTVHNTAFCMTCSLLCRSRMQEAIIWKRHSPEPVS